jgi:hypothetical protein
VYAITATAVVQSGVRFVPERPTLSVEVAASDTATAASVRYIETVHALTVTVSGLPARAHASVSIHGPGSYSTTVTATETLSLAAEGTYTVEASSVLDSVKTYTAATASSTVTVTESTSPLSVAVAYALASVPFVVTVSGLPDTVPAIISVTGPSGFPSQTLTSSATLWPYLTGSYAVAAASVQVSNRTFVPAPARATVTMSGPGTSLTLNIAYAAPRVARLTLSPVTLTAQINLAEGVFVANELDALGNPLRDSVTWTSSDTAVAIVDPAGTVTARSAGVTTVTASIDGISAGALVTVPVPVIDMVAGRWTFALGAHSASTGGRCTDAGELDISQAVGASALNVTGSQTGNCTFNSEVVRNFANPIATTGASANGIRLALGPCKLSGGVSSSAPNTLSGTVSCKVDRYGTTRSVHFVATGTWSAQRIP